MSLVAEISVGLNQSMPLVRPGTAVSFKYLVAACGPLCLCRWINIDSGSLVSIFLPVGIRRALFPPSQMHGFPLGLDGRSSGRCLYVGTGGALHR